MDPMSSGKSALVGVGLRPAPSPPGAIPRNSFLPRSGRSGDGRVLDPPLQGTGNRAMDSMPSGELLVGKEDSPQRRRGHREENDKRAAREPRHRSASVASVRSVVFSF